MENIYIQNSNDIIDFGLYTMSKPLMYTKALSNPEFVKFCRRQSGDKILYRITHKSGIYAFRKKDNQQIVYIGQAVNLLNRIGQHLNETYNPNLKNYNMRLHAAIRKYGPQAFEVVLLAVIDEVNHDELDKLEKEFIAKHNTYQDNAGYNYTAGGQDSSGLGLGTFRKDRDEDIKILNSIKQFLKDAEDNETYLTPESAVAELNILKLTPGVLLAINNGNGYYYDPKYHGSDVDNKQPIYNFVKNRPHITKSDDEILCTVFVKNPDDIPEHWNDSCIATDHAGRPLVFVGNHEAISYIHQAFGITSIDDRTIASMIKGNRATHSLVAKYIGTPKQVFFDTADMKAIDNNIQQIFNDIKFEQIYVDCVVMVDVNTAKEYRFRKTYGCAVFLVEQGLINYDDRFNTAAIIKSKLNKDKEHLGYIYYTEPIKLQDWYELN